MSKPQVSGWVAPYDAVARRRLFWWVLCPFVVLFGLALALWTGSGAYHTNCINSLFWCSDSRFYMQVASRVMYAVALTTVGGLAVYQSLLAIRRRTWPALSRSQYRQLAPREDSAQLQRSVRVTRGGAAVALALLALTMGLLLIAAGLLVHLRPVLGLLY